MSLPVLVLYPIPPEQVEAAAWSHIAVAAGGGELLGRILAAAGAASAAGAPDLVVHLEVETGLGRGGALPDGATAAARAIGSAPGVRLAGVWTHLAAPDDDASAAAQDARFAVALLVLGTVGVGVGRPAPPRGQRRDPRRPGGPLGRRPARGSPPTGSSRTRSAPRPELAGAGDALRPVLALYARPVRVVELPAGHGVSYGPSFVTTRPSRVATLPLGYGDGWHRAWSDRAAALVRGMRVPIVGRVAMDAVMVDVTDVPGDPVTEADEFVLVGEQGSERITALDLAATGGTISYEVVTGMSRRLPRVYHAAGSPVEIRYLAGGRSEWHASSSGTGTSATSRSMPS